MIKVCRFCNKKIQYDKQLVFATHCANCSENPNRGGRLKKIGIAKTKKERNLFCKKCGNVYSVFASDLLYKKGKYRKHCSRRCANTRLQSEETKRKISVAVKSSEKFRSSANDWTPERRAKLSISMKNNRNAEKQNYNKTNGLFRVGSCVHCKKEILSPRNVKRKYHTECWKKCSGGYRENSTIKHRCVYNGASLDSGSELQFAKLLDEHEIKWKKNKSITFAYAGVDGKSHLYYPDFYLAEYDFWVEIKGRYYETENDPLKLKSVGSNIELMYHDEIRLPRCYTNGVRVS